MTMRLLDAAVRLYVLREREEIDLVFEAVKLRDFDYKLHQPDSKKIWFWACKRWKEFPKREYEARERLHNEYYARNGL